MMNSKYPRFSEPNKRFDSFRVVYSRSDSWQLAFAGFFYTGVDCVLMCFHCGLALKRVMPARALEEHIFWNESCCLARHLKQSKVEPRRSSRLSVSGGESLSTRLTRCTSNVPRLTRARFDDARAHVYGEMQQLQNAMNEMLDFYRKYIRLLKNSGDLVNEIAMHMDVLEYASRDYVQRHDELIHQLNRQIDDLQLCENICPTREISMNYTPIAATLSANDISAPNCTTCMITRATDAVTTGSTATSSERIDIIIGSGGSNDDTEDDDEYSTPPPPPPPSSLTSSSSSASSSDDSPPLPSQKQSQQQQQQHITDRDTECSVCYANKRNVLYLPCRHFVTCLECARRVASRCPVCRALIYYKLVAIY